MDVADRLHIWQDAGADEQGEEVDSYQHSGANTEGNQKDPWVIVLHLQLHLHHGHLQMRPGSRKNHRKSTPVAYIC